MRHALMRSAGLGRERATLAAVILACAVVSTSSQVPPRDVARTGPTGTGAIAGHVAVAASPSGPIRRARVSLSGDNVPGGQFTDTDTNGNYRFSSLAAGSYRVRVEKPGFVALEYGAKWAFVQPPAISLTQGQFTADFALPKGAALEGRILTERGEPLLNATVTAMRLFYTLGGKRPTTVGQATTDDLGRFRIHSLPPGEYYVSAVDGDVNRAMRPVATGQRRVNYALTYFPGSAKVDEAKQVKLALGQEVSGLDFVITPVPVVEVRALVTNSQDASPAPAASLASLQPLEQSFDAVRRLYLAADRGIFTFPLTPPGSYWLLATIAPEGTKPAEFAATRVEVAENTSELRVRTEPGTSFLGRLETDATQASPQLPGLLIVSVEMAYPMPTLRTAAQFSSNAIVSDGKFAIASLYGPRIFRVNGLPADWAVKRVTLDNRDITDTPIDFRFAPEPRSLVVTVTNKTASVSGTAVDTDRRPATAYRVVVFADDERQWALPSRFVKSVLSSSNRRFSIEGLLPGTYRIAALEYLEDESWNDPDVLRTLRVNAATLTLKEDSRETIALSLRAQP